LNERSNQLAHYLIEEGVKSGDFIGITTTRGFDMIIGMLAFLRQEGLCAQLIRNIPKKEKNIS